MKVRIWSVLLVLALVVAALGAAQPVQAASYGASFVTSITYQNVDTVTADISILFYPAGSDTPIVIDQPALAPLAGASVYVGGLSAISQGFRGSAVVQSDAKLAVTLVQVPAPDETLKNRPLSNGLATGSPQVLIPTVLKDYFGSHTTSVFSVQNVDSGPVDLKLHFVPVDGSPIDKAVTGVPAGSASYFDMGTLPDITAPQFNGSVQISATKAGTTDPANVVASSMELSGTADDAYAFEGAVESAGKFYMPSALCKFGPSHNQTSAYAVQNTSTDATASVSVKYSNGNTDGPYDLAPGAKRSFDGCSVNDANFLGSATVEASGANIVAMGKIYGGGLSTAFLGFANGSAVVSLPYVRWTEAHWADGSRQRTNIAVQNIGDSDLDPEAVVVEYYDKDGNLVGTHKLGAILVGAKANSNPYFLGTVGYEFGAYTDGSFGGSAIVRGPEGSKLAVVARVETNVGGGSTVGEDYTGIPVETAPDTAPAG